MSDIQSARLATIVALVEKRPALGRTAVMKLCYFLQTLRSVPLGYRFTLYSYGPFDAGVLSDLSSAETLGGIESKTVLYAGGYGYEISPASKRGAVKALAPDFIKKHGPDINWVIEKFGAFGSADLELLSTIVYVDRDSAQAKAKQTTDTLAVRVQEIKPRFKNSYVKNKVEYLAGQQLLRSFKATSGSG
ncbi:MAG: hypothetical protein ACLQOO_05090 [Terriglobia bacterium]